MSSFFLRVVFLLNVVAILFLFLSYTASYISPDGNLWWLQLFGLVYGFLLIINVAFIIFWLVLRKRKFLFSFFAILIGFGKIFGILQPGIGTNENAASKTHLPYNTDQPLPLKVMSFNVRLFDLYNWFRNDQTRKKIFEFLKQESPDIVCFQEYYHSDNKKSVFANNDTLSHILLAPFSHIEYNVTLRKQDHWGIATFSKYPIINKKAVHF